MGLTSTDIAILKLAADDGNIFSRHYFAGFEFQPWQLLLHHTHQANITIIGGVGSGKTVGTGISAATWAAMIEDFHFMDIAPTSWQATLMYDAILRFAEAGLYGEKFIVGAARRPYPLITLYNQSTLRFMTAQDDISRLRGWEGDWMGGDEFGFVNTLATTAAIMRTRLRGKSVRGRPRLGRLSMTTTATDNPELWERFDRMYENDKEYLSFTVRTKDNPHLTDRDIQLMEEDIPEEIRAVEMDGIRPMGRGRFFPIHVVKSCENAALNDLVHRETLEDVPDPGYIYEAHPRYGVTKFQMPYLPGRDYFIAGDPGTGNVPKRNAGVIGVFDITGFPEEFDSKARLVAFGWVDGRGRYDAFVEQYKSWWEYYRCGMQACLEATGPQKSFAEYAFTIGLSGQRMLIEEMDLSGNKKNEALQACMQLFNRGLFELPLIRGMRNQLTSYDLPDTKLSQDIVSMLMTAAAWLRSWRIWGHDEVTLRNEEEEDDQPHDLMPVEPARAARAQSLEARPSR